MAKTGVNPLNVHHARRVDFCPPYFEFITITPSYSLNKTLDEWIYENTSSRYYIGNTVEASEGTPFKQKIKIGFENPSELSFFMLACPLLKYSK